MIKTALVCCFICSALLIGNHSTAIAQDTSTKATQPATIQDALRPLIGKRCVKSPDAGSLTLYFKPSVLKSNQKISIYTLDMVGRDFIRLTNQTGSCYVPISSIMSVWTN